MKLWQDVRILIMKAIRILVTAVINTSANYAEGKWMLTIQELNILANRITARSIKTALFIRTDKKIFDRPKTAVLQKCRTAVNLYKNL